jgi:hypothetical protein
MLLDLLDRPGRCSGRWPHDGEVAGGAVAHFSDIPVRGDDGARAIGAIDDDAAPAGERSELRGHRQQIGKSAALTEGSGNAFLQRKLIAPCSRSHSVSKMAPT